LSAYSEAKGSVLRQALAEVSAKDPPDITARARDVAAEEGITDSLLIARIGWLAVAERKRCAKILRALDKHYGWDEYDNRPFRLAVKAILDPSPDSAAKAIKRFK
jgi:hypothetical protein